MKNTSLKQFENVEFERGRAKIIELAWIIVSKIIIEGSIPGSNYRRAILRWFGADIGYGVIVKPGVKIKFPWKLKVGEYSWIGENSWIDNLAEVEIGDNVCISQGVYLCTGSHNWSKESFDLIVRPIVLENNSWIAAFCVVGPGVTIGEGTVLGLGSTTTKSLESWKVYSGFPAAFIRDREIVKESKRY